MQANYEAKWEAIDLSLSLCKELVERPGRLTTQLEVVVFIWEWRCLSGWTNMSLPWLGEDPTQAEAKVHPIQ